MKPLTDKITAAIIDAPGDLQGVPPVVVRAVVARALAELPEAILARTLPEEDDRLDRYTLRDLLEEEWVTCEDGSVWLERETASDAEGATMPRAYWEALAKEEARTSGVDHFSAGCIRCGEPTTITGRCLRCYEALRTAAPGAPVPERSPS